MDTRSKIVEPAPSDSLHLPAVVGYFDPLHAGHVRRLRQLAGPGGQLVVLLDDPPNPLLPSRARAELLASLGVVRYVLIGMEHAAGFPALFDERETDAESALAFAKHVLARHSAE